MMLITEDAKVLQEVEKLAKHGTNKSHMSMMIKMQLLEQMETIITAETQVVKKKECGAIPLTLTHHGNSVIQLVG